MAERWIPECSRILEVEKRYQKTGVVLFVFNQAGELFLTQEKLARAQTGKLRGDYGTVAETREKGEMVSEAFVRAVQEELQIEPHNISSFLKFNPENFYLGESFFIEGALAWVGVAYWTADKEMLLANNNSDEVKKVGWVELEDFGRYNLRPGVRNVFEEFRGFLQQVARPDHNRLLPFSVDSLSNFSLEAVDDFDLL